MDLLSTGAHKWSMQWSLLYSHCTWDLSLLLQYFSCTVDSFLFMSDSHTALSTPGKPTWSMSHCSSMLGIFQFLVHFKRESKTLSEKVLNNWIVWSLCFNSPSQYHIFVNIITSEEFKWFWLNVGMLKQLSRNTPSSFCVFKWLFFSLYLWTCLYSTLILDWLARCKNLWSHFPLEFWRFSFFFYLVSSCPIIPPTATLWKKENWKTPKLHRTRNWGAGKNWDQLLCSHGTSINRYMSLCGMICGSVASPPSLTHPINSGCHGPSLSLQLSGSVLPHVLFNLLTC